ncbi:MAG: hypothetical protein SP4CHLAM5_04100 [Chlamydiia bacterium]|nr:hypothetical protein [Chlamydiia bacterium]MCH9618283.1 hypothetical protein [Chlamydiia bacterium]MCH9624156.1 hypothetical protein [Chlamydiia bacterium]
MMRKIGCIRNLEDYKTAGFSESAKGDSDKLHFLEFLQVF